MTEAKRIRTVEEKRESEQVVSILAHKIKKGTATERDKALYRDHSYELVIHDWLSPSYQNAEENHLAAKRREKEEKQRAKRRLIAPAPEKKLPQAEEKRVVGLPPLTRKPGRFAV